MITEYSSSFATRSITIANVVVHFALAVLKTYDGLKKDRHIQLGPGTGCDAGIAGIKLLDRGRNATGPDNYVSDRGQVLTSRAVSFQ